MYSAGVGSANEEAHCKVLKTNGGMPGGGHLLPIFLAIPYFVMNQSNIFRKTVFSCFMRIGLYVSQIAFGRFARKTSERSCIHCDYVRLSLLFAGMCCFKTFALIVGCARGEVWNVINFLWEGEVT